MTDEDAYDYWKEKFKARLELVLNELRHYWSEETVQAAAPLIEDLDLEIKSVTYIKPTCEKRQIFLVRFCDEKYQQSPDS